MRVSAESASASRGLGWKLFGNRLRRPCSLTAVLWVSRPSPPLLSRMFCCSCESPRTAVHPLSIWRRPGPDGRRQIESPQREAAFASRVLPAERRSPRLRPGRTRASTRRSERAAPVPDQRSDAWQPARRSFAAHPVRPWPSPGGAQGNQRMADERSCLALRDPRRRVRLLCARVTGWFHPVGSSRSR
jgi:hypothetical protein